MKTLISVVMVGALAALVAAYGGHAASPSSKLVTSTARIPVGSKGRVVARCPGGMHATGGGFRTAGVAANDSYPLITAGRASGWVLTTHKPKTPTTGAATPGSATAFALCAR